MDLNLRILPSPTTYIKSIQKCKLPIDYIPEGISIGDLIKVKTKSNLEYIVKLFPLISHAGSDYCYMDSSVNILNESMQNNYTQHDDNYIIGVEKLDIATDSINSIFVEIIITEKIFTYIKELNSILEDMIRDALLPYYLTTNSCVQFEDDIKSFGLEKAIIIKSIPSCTSAAFCIESNTIINIENCKMNLDESIELTDLAGIDDYITEIDEIIENLNVCQNLTWNIRPSLNALIIGPTGSGKTSLCHNFIIKNACNIFTIKPSNIMQQYSGETEKQLSNIFHNAKIFSDNFQSKYPTVIFVEDVELICPSKVSQTQDSAHINRICGQFCSLMDEIYNSSGKIIILGICSNIEMLNTALRRPGRFEKEISLSTLNDDKREKIINLLLKKSAWEINENTGNKLSKFLAELTTGFVAADIVLLMEKLFRKFEIGNKEENQLISNFKEIALSILKTIKPTSLKGTDVSVYKSDETFENLGGMDSLKQILCVSVLFGLKHPEAFRRFGLHLPKGILLYGPPGCAKTTIAKCLASEAKMTFISTSGAEVYSPYVGNAEKFISKIFDVARKNSPCLIFLDEIDTLVGNRSITSKNDVQTRVLSTLLTEIDGIGLKIHSGSGGGGDLHNNNILVIAATNRPDMVDNALMRPGRFDKLIHIPPPDKQSRIAILKIYKNKMPFNEDIDIERLAENMENFSGADICNLCNEAAMYAFTEDFNANVIKAKHFTAILEKTKSSLTEKQISWYYDFEKRYIS